MLDINNAPAINQNSFNKTIYAIENPPLADQMKTLEGLFNKEDGSEIMILLLRLIMQLIQSLDLNGQNNNDTPTDDPDGLEAELRQNIFMSMLQDSFANTNIQPAFPVFGDDAEEEESVLGSA